jgi:hypothetical protein
MILQKFKSISVLSDNTKYDIQISKENDKPIYGFYHIYCANDWAKIVNEQVITLKKSGLYDLVDTIYVCVIKSNEIDIDQLKQILPSKFKITIETQNPKDYEFPILKYLQSKARIEDFYCFYFHTKGTSVIEKSKKIGEKSWRTLMEYFIFTKYNMAINALKDGYGCYGSLYKTSFSYPHFAGNFWWATSKYITSLSNINTLTDNRYNAELWIGSSNNAMDPYIAYNSTIDAYYVPIPEFLYVKRKLYFSDLWPVTKCYLTHILKGLTAKIKFRQNR